ncbi:hypothetical protein [Nesterenkonia ebinurensis]|uniref:hypothetical protein n=1 Tax=Nesterenkonia ebinurensis TaxID=2608252 RepID=UPI00123D534A|nr:hypothetical protein [Nesterenkonia ebinurensis]
MSTRRLDELKLSVQDQDHLDYETSAEPDPTLPLSRNHEPTMPLSAGGFAAAPPSGPSPEPYEEETSSGAPRRTLMIAGAVIAALLAALLLLRLLIPAGPSTAEIFEDLDIVGQEWTEARQEIRSAGAGDSDYQLVEPDSAAADSGAEMLVDRVEIDAENDDVTVYLEPDTAQFLAQLGLEGMSWPQAQEALAEAELEQGSDYEVLTDRGEVWVERNWNVAEVRTEGDVPAVILTNPMQNRIDDTGQGVANWTDEQWQNLQEWDPRDTWQDVEDTFSDWGEELENLLP